MTSGDGAEEPAAVRLSTVSVTAGSRRLEARVARPVQVSVDGCPVVAFGHGFVQRASFYDTLLAAVAARGYVAVAPETETGPRPSHGRLADDLWHCAEWARETVTWSGEGPGMALAGHSMGAGAALLAAARHPHVDTVVALAALQTRPPVDLDAVVAPTLFVAGSQDRVVPPARSRRLYEGVGGPARWALIRGGYHCGYLDRARWRDAGCDHGDLSRAEQLDLTARLVGDWLDAVFRGRAFEAPAGVDLDSRGTGE